MNVIALSLFNAIVSYHYKNIEFMKSVLENQYGKGEFIKLLNPENNDFIYFYVTNTSVYSGIRGTDGGKAWLNNAECTDGNKDGFHDGWIKSYEFFRLEVYNIIKCYHEKRFVSGAHSRGTAFNTLMALRAKIDLGKYIKPINFCPPYLTNEHGAKFLMENKIDQINILNKNDFVNNVGINAFFGIHYGTTIILPNKEFSFREWLKDMIPGIGHAPTEVLDGTVQYFYGRKMPEEVEFLKSKRRLCKV